ncbi:MAG TPA: hypothetical protein VGX72_00030 [Solirubrobacteraceae bacterium]|nr:hypothetical protein [Solirubrobacteraceae bacterium]
MEKTSAIGGLLGIVAMLAAASPASAQVQAFGSFITATNFSNASPFAIGLGEVTQVEPSNSTDYGYEIPPRLLSGCVRRVV